VAIFDPAIFDGQVSKLFDTPAVTGTVGTGAGGTGKSYRYIPFTEEKKLTKRQENSLKKLLIAAAEEEKQAKQKFEARVAKLQAEIGVLTGLREIVAEVEQYFINQKQLDQITTPELIQRLDIIHEEEEIVMLLLIA